MINHNTQAILVMYNINPLFFALLARSLIKKFTLKTKTSYPVEFNGSEYAVETVKWYNLFLLYLLSMTKPIYLSYASCLIDSPRQLSVFS